MADIKSFLRSITAKDNYDEVIAYLSVDETKHAPFFDFDSAPAELRELLTWIQKPRGEERSAWLNNYAQKSLEAEEGTAEVILADKHLNDYRYLNRFIRSVNAKLKQDGYFISAFDTAQKRKAYIFSKYPRFIAKIVFFFDFIWHRLFPKMTLTKRFYFWCTKKVKKVYPRPEVLGRLYYCGFDVVSEQYVHDRYVVIAQKKRQPSAEPHTYGAFIRLNRVGKDGKMFPVYKFRTMYAYSEFLQSYINANNGLAKGGKFDDDYRVTEWGHVLRKLWLDELPMFINVFKGQMKLVGVRPLSKHYFSLYSPEIQELRVKAKPGMLPPYYVDMPETLEEIQESEKRYTEAYLQKPFRTDWKYFWKIIANILFKGKRSK